MNWWEEIVISSVIGILGRVAHNPAAAKVEVGVIKHIISAAQEALTALGG